MCSRGLPSVDGGCDWIEQGRSLTAIAAEEQRWIWHKTEGPEVSAAVHSMTIRGRRRQSIRGWNAWLFTKRPKPNCLSLLRGRELGVERMWRSRHGQLNTLSLSPPQPRLGITQRVRTSTLPPVVAVAGARLRRRRRHHFALRPEQIGRGVALSGAGCIGVVVVVVAAQAHAVAPARAGEEGGGLWVASKEGGKSARSLGDEEGGEARCLRNQDARARTNRGMGGRGGVLVTQWFECAGLFFVWRCGLEMLTLRTVLEKSQ